jgi:hypothetical protein
LKHLRKGGLGMVSPLRRHFQRVKFKIKDFGNPLLSRSFGGVSYYGSCDLGSVINVIYNTFYWEILEDIALSILYGTDITIQMADRTLRVPLGNSYECLLKC